MSSSTIQKGPWKYLPLPEWIDTIIDDNVMVAKELISGKKIILMTRKANFQTAVRACAAINAKIILPVSRMENEEINKFLLEELGDTGRAWLRITDSDSEGKWYDTSHNSFVYSECSIYYDCYNKYTNWYANEPNNKGGLEDYAAIYTQFWKATGYLNSWNDVQGTDTLHIVCEL